MRELTKQKNLDSLTLDENSKLVVVHSGRKVREARPIRYPFIVQCFDIYGGDLKERINADIPNEANAYLRGIAHSFGGNTYVPVQYYKIEE